MYGKLNFGIALLLSAAVLCSCGKKASTPPVPPTPPTPPPTQTETPATAIEGKWSSECLVVAGGSYVQKINVKGTILGFVQTEFTDEKCSRNAKISGDKHSVIRTVQLNDSVMTHRVEELNPSGAVHTSWVLRLEQDGKSLLVAPESFLKTRDAGEYGNRFKKQN